MTQKSKSSACFIEQIITVIAAIDLRLTFERGRVCACANVRRHVEPSVVVESRCSYASSSQVVSALRMGRRTASGTFLDRRMGIPISRVGYHRRACAIERWEFLCDRVGNGRGGDRTLGSRARARRGLRRSALALARGCWRYAAAFQTTNPSDPVVGIVRRSIGRGSFDPFDGVKHQGVAGAVVRLVDRASARRRDRHDLSFRGYPRTREASSLNEIRTIRG
jgi:hypothetical protein